MAESVISIDNLGKRYFLGSSGPRRSPTDMLAAILPRLGRGPQEFWALRGVGFDVHRGDVLGVIGRNGAGKSTLLKLLSRIAEPTEGSATIRGRVGSLLEVGTGFHPELTGRENIFLNGAILGMKTRQIKARFEQIVDFAGVEKFLDTPVKRYSSGMRVRLGFAVAAHLDPEILIVDEVLAVGDAEFQAKCLGKMSQVAKAGRTVLFVSHNMAAVQSLCTRALVLSGGRVGFAGSVSDAVDYYYSLGVAGNDSGRYVAANPQGAGGACVVAASVTCDEQYRPEGYPIGAPLEFVVHCRAARPIRKPALGIGIDHGGGQRIVTLHSAYGGAPGGAETIGPGDYTFHCRIEDLALAPGLYRVKLSLESLDGEEEVIEPAMNFHILDSDYYDSKGRRGAGLILCRQNWTLAPTGHALAASAPPPA